MFYQMKNMKTIHYLRFYFSEYVSYYKDYENDITLLIVAFPVVRCFQTTLEEKHLKSIYKNNLIKEYILAWISLPFINRKPFALTLK